MADVQTLALPFRITPDGQLARTDGASAVLRLIQAMVATTATSWPHARWFGLHERFLAVNADVATRYPADSPEAMARFVRDQGWPIPYLYDESQDVARALDAQVTPHVFVFDGDHRLRYRGAPDGDHRDESEGAKWLRDALDAILAGDTPQPEDTQARGCSVKWRS